MLAVTADLTAAAPDAPLFADRSPGMTRYLLVFITLALTAACSGGDAPQPAPGDAADSGAAEPAETDFVAIEPGLDRRILKKGYGREAIPGDYAAVHYTGWLHDDTAADGRGEKFDSSVDRGQRFQFTLGAGQVIRGWDRGVQGMLIGEKRELRIAPELAYGDRGAGGGAIPPGATLLFEIELLDLDSPQ